MLNVRFAYIQIVSFSFPPQATPCCLEIAVVQFSLGDGSVIGRGEVSETEAREISPGLQNVLQYSQHISGYDIVLYWLTCIFPI